MDEFTLRVSGFKTQSFKEGATVLKEAGSTGKVYILREGVVRIIKKTVSGVLDHKENTAII